MNPADKPPYIVSEVKTVGSTGSKPKSKNLYDSPENPNGGLYAPDKDNEGGFLPPIGDVGTDEIQVEHGQSGTLIFGGFISGEEYNKNLEGRQGYAIYDQMRRSDGMVGATLRVIKLPILSAEWDIEEASDSAQDKQMAEFVKDNLFDDNIDFEAFLRQAMTMLDFGFSIFEKVYEPDKRNGQTGIYLKKLAFRKQTTVFRWETMQKTKGITQVTYSGGQFSIPEQMLARFTWEQEGDNYEGVSILRGAYKHWYFKDLFEKIWGIMIERQGVGIPQLTAPPEADEASKEQARQALRNLRSNEQAYIEIPKGYIIDFMDMKGKTTAEIQTAIQYHDRAIATNVLAQFLTLGSNSKGATGSHALSADQSRLFEQHLEAVANKFEEVVNNQIIKQLIDLNFSNVTKYPKLRHGRIADDNIQLMADALSKLMQADALTPDPDLEQSVRDMLHLPALPDAYRKDYNNRPRAQAAIVPLAPGGKNPDGTPADGGEASKQVVDDDADPGALVGQKVQAAEDRADEAERRADAAEKHTRAVTVAANEFKSRLERQIAAAGAAGDGS